MIKEGVRYYLEPPVPPGYSLLGVNLRKDNFILAQNNSNITVLDKLHTLQLFECYEKYSGRHFIFAKRRIPSLQELCIEQFRDDFVLQNGEDIVKNGRLIDPPTYFTNTFYSPLFRRQIRFTFYLQQDEEGKWFMTTQPQKQIPSLNFWAWLVFGD